MNLNGVDVPLFLVLILIFGPILVILRMIASSPGTNRLKTWLNSPASGSAPPYWVVFGIAGIANVRHFFEPEPCYWPAMLAFGLAICCKRANVHNRGDVQRVLDPVLGVKRRE